MKRNLYDVFDKYDGSLPDLKNQKTNVNSIESLVMKKINGKKKIYKSRLFIIGIAAALMAGGSITASAVSDTGFFHRILYGSEIVSSEKHGLPMVQEDVYDQMSENFKFDQITFSGNDSCEIKLESMYSDNSTAMIIISAKPDKMINIQDDSSVVAYFTFESADNNKDILTESAQAVYNEEDQKYYMTYYITKDNMSGNMLKIEVQGIYSQDQINQSYSELQEFQQELRTNHNAESMSIEEWKALWKKENFDMLSFNTHKEYLQQSDGIKGNWTEQMEIPDRSESIITSENNDFSVTIDNLSVEVEYPDNYKNNNADIISVEFKDGTKISSASGTNIEEILKRSGFTQYSKFAFESGCNGNKGRIMCYDKPHSPEEIKSVTLYQAEDKPDGDLSEVCVMYQKNK